MGLIWGNGTPLPGWCSRYRPDKGLLYNILQAAGPRRFKRIVTFRRYLLV